MRLAVKPNSGPTRSSTRPVPTLDPRRDAPPPRSRTGRHHRQRRVAAPSPRPQPSWRSRSGRGYCPSSPGSPPPSLDGRSRPIPSTSPAAVNSRTYSSSMIASYSIRRVPVPRSKVAAGPARGSKSGARILIVGSANSDRDEAINCLIVAIDDALGGRREPNHRRVLGRAELRGPGRLRRSLRRAPAPATSQRSLGIDDEVPLAIDDIGCGPPWRFDSELDVGRDVEARADAIVDLRPPEGWLT